MKKTLAGLLSFIFILSMSGCSCKEDEEISQGSIVVPNVEAYLSKDINGEKTLVSPFNTSISLSYFYQSDKEKIEAYFIDNFQNLHSLFDRHYYYFDDQGNLINNLRVINESDGEAIKVDEDLIQIFKEGIRFTKLSNGKFNIGVGALSDLWNGFIDIGSVFTYGDLDSIYTFKYENGVYYRDSDGTYVNYYGVYVDISEMRRYSLEDGNYVDDVNGRYVLLTNISPTQEQITQAKLCVPSYQEIENVIVIDDVNNTITINKPDGCNGDFSITLGALAKSYVAEKISHDKRIKDGNFLINVGQSTIKLVGDNLVRENGVWNVGVTDSYLIYDREVRFASYLMSLNKDVSISTSSGDENHYRYNDNYYHHIIDPISGYPNQNRLSITAVGKNAMYVDIITTTLMSMDMNETRQYLNRLKNEGISVELFIQEKENDFVKVYVSKNLKNKVSKRSSQTLQEHIDSIVIEEFSYDS